MIEAKFPVLVTWVQVPQVLEGSMKATQGWLLIGV